MYTRDKETTERALKSSKFVHVKKKRMRRKRCIFPVFSSLPCLSVCLSVRLSFSFLSFYISQNSIVFKLENTNRRVLSEKRYICFFLFLTFLFFVSSRGKYLNIFLVNIFNNTVNYLSHFPPVHKSYREHFIWKG